MTKHSEVFVAFDTSKLRNAVAIAEAGRAGEIHQPVASTNPPLRRSRSVQPLMTCRKPIRRCQNRGVTLPPRHIDFIDELATNCSVGPSDSPPLHAGYVAPC